MRIARSLFIVAGVSGAAVFMPVAGCEKKPVADTVTKSTGPATGTAGAHDHKAGDGHDHGHDHGSGKAIDLGEQATGAFTVKAARDEGQIVAGKDAPIDIVVTPAAGTTSKVAAVRFWIGTQDAKGSVKAKGEIEDSKEPNRWHAHAETPNPLPAECKLWVEVETQSGEKLLTSFGLKQ